MTFKASPQQQTVFDFVTSGQGNAFVVAVAGAGKTTTLLHAIERMSGDVAFVAYNKKIAVEIGQKLKARGVINPEKPWLINLNDATVASGTFHSFGYKAWLRKNKGCELNEKAKWDELLQDIEPAYHDLVVKLVDLARDRALGVNNRLGNFGSIDDVQAWYKIVTHYNLMEMLEEGMTIQRAVQLAQVTLRKSIAIATRVIDFADMIYMPVLRDIGMWGNQWVLVDEAQDTNPARRCMARKMMARGGRIIFVGDPCQAIYGFTGADADSVEQIIRDFRCVALPLTVTYRCPKAVVKAAQAYVSHIQAHESAPEGAVGVVRALDEFKSFFPQLKADDAILCRKTKPLVELAYSLIRAKIACHVEGKEIGRGLIKLATKWKSLKSSDKYLDKLEAWTAERAAKFTAKGQDTQAEAAWDRFETMKVLCEGRTTMAEVVTAIEELFKDAEDETVRTLTLSTVHKSKGREWGHVYVYGFREWMPSPMAKLDWEREQEKNLIYVAFTRAQNVLTLVG